MARLRMAYTKARDTVNLAAELRSLRFSQPLNAAAQFERLIKQGLWKQTSYLICTGRSHEATVVLVELKRWLPKDIHWPPSKSQ